MSSGRRWRKGIFKRLSKARNVPPRAQIPHLARNDGRSFYGEKQQLQRTRNWGSDLRNRARALPHCWCRTRLLESEQDLLRSISHA